MNGVVEPNGMTVEQMIETAADWWARALANPKFDMGAGSDLGGQMAEILAAMDAAQHRPTEEEISRFRAAMVDYLRREPREPSVFLGVDYGPGWELQQILDAAGVTGLSFPWKTSMWLNWEHGSVRVRYGYGARIQNLNLPHVG